MSFVKLFANAQVYDKDRPDSTISCKCTVGNDGGLEIKQVIIVKLSMHPDPLAFWFLSYQMQALSLL